MFHFYINKRINKPVETIDKIVDNTMFQPIATFTNKQNENQSNVSLGVQLGMSTMDCFQPPNMSEGYEQTNEV